MIQESYVTFEQAKALKELGFPFKILDTKYSSDYIGKGMVIDTEVFAVYPTLSLVQKWLREERDLDVLPYKKEYGGHIIGNYMCKIATLEIFGTKNCFIGIMDEYEIYEQALSAGIDKCIELLKEKKDVV